MDLLQQYQQEHPQAFREKQAGSPSGEHGFFIRLVMRLSGGRIRDARQAHKVLLAGCIIIVLVATYFFISAIGGNTGKPLPYEQTYKPFQ